MKKGTKKESGVKKVNTKRKTVKKENTNNKGLIILCVVIVLFGILLITLCPKKWVRNGNVVSRGNVSYEIGDYYEYDESLEGEYTDLTDVKWKVMGVDEDGNLLIISSSKVADLTLGNTEDFNNSLDDYLSGEDDINALTKAYGKGENAVYARSVDLDDYLNVFNLKRDNLSAYEMNTVSYTWTKDNKIQYNIHETNETGVSSIDHGNVFVFFDEKENEWKLVHKYDTEDKVEIGTIKSNLVSFNRVSFAGEEQVTLYDEDTKAFKMMCKDEKSYINSYWLATRYVFGNNNYAHYGFNVVKRDSVNLDYMTNSYGKTRSTTHGVRAVVAIK